MDMTEFVIDNCVRQSATEPKDFIGMTRACVFGATLLDRYFIGQPVRRTPITVLDILTLALRVNSVDVIMWRNTEVTFANGNHGASPRQIDRLIEQLLDNQHDITPEEFYWEFERIHPFTDGNGRVGAILYSVLKEEFWVNPPEMTW